MPLSRHAVLAFATAALLLTSIATSAYGLFLPVLQADFSWSRAAASLPFTVAMISWGVVAPFVGKLVDDLGTRPVMLGGILFMSAGFLTMAAARTLWQLALAYGVLVGISLAACGVNVVAVLISKHFPAQGRGLAVSISQAASPANPLLMTPLLFWVLAGYHWRTAAVGIGVMLLLLALPLAWVGARDPAPARGQGIQRLRWAECLPRLRRPDVVRLFLARFSCGLSFFLIAHMVTIALSKGLSASTGAAGMTVFGGTAVAASLLSGWLADRYGRGRVLGMTYFLRGVGCIVLGLFLTGPWPYYLGVTLAAGPIFGTIAVNNVMIYEAVGPRMAGMTLGLSYVIHQAAAAGAPLVGGWVFDLTGTYDWFLVALGVVMLGSAALTYTLPDTRAPERGQAVSAPAPGA